MDYQAVLDQIHAEVQPLLGRGQVASYIPELAKVRGDQFRMAVVTLDGTDHSCGQARTAISIKSVSKLFSLTLAFQCAGEERWERVTTNGWRLHLAVFDENDSQIRDDTSFQCLFHGAGTHLLSGNLTLDTASPECLRHRMFGNPGVAGGRGSDNAAANRVSYGGFAVSLEGWIGPYLPNEGP